MSHIATVEIEIKDLDALEEAAKRIGMELVRGQETYRWFGSMFSSRDEMIEWLRKEVRQEDQGEGEMPPGFTLEDRGKCSHMLRVAGGNPETYEVGVARRRDGRPGFILMGDFMDNRLGSVVGDGCKTLQQAYATAVATRQARRKGFRVNETRLANGSIQLRLSK